MCNRDHEPVGTYGGMAIITCDDVPRSMAGWPVSVLPTDDDDPGLAIEAP